MMNTTLVIAHRGASSYTKENTLAAFQLAMELKADMIEFDVRKTKDGIFIAFHNQSIGNLPVSEITFTRINEIARKDGFRIPEIKEIILLAKGKIKLDIELKEEGYEEEIINYLLKYLRKDEFIISSFNDSSLMIVKRIFPSIKVGLILGRENHKKILKIRLSEIFPVKRIKRIKADFLIFHKRLLKLLIPQQILMRNISLMVWTINEKKEMEKFLHNRLIYGIITDKPDLGILLRNRNV